MTFLKYTILILLSATMVHAEDAATASAPAGQETNLEQMEQPTADEEKKEPIFRAKLIEKYGLTEAQIDAAKASGVKGPGLAMAAEIAKASGKTFEEVVQMRTEGKTGWGKIAKDLGVEPKLIGQSVASLRKDVRDARQERKAERKEERKAKHDAMKADKRAKRDEKKANK